MHGCDDRRTFHCNVDAGRQEQSTEAIVEDLIALQSRRGVIGDLDTWTEEQKAVGYSRPTEAGREAE